MEKGYLITRYGYYECSECGAKYTKEEYFKYYSLDKIVKWYINCKMCGAQFHEDPKLCYWEEHHPSESCACSERMEIDGKYYCSQQLTHRKQELRSWGSYYKCECYEPIKKDPEYTQLSFFDE